MEDTLKQHKKHKKRTALKDDVKYELYMLIIIALVIKQHLQTNR